MILFVAGQGPVSRVLFEVPLLLGRTEIDPRLDSGMSSSRSSTDFTDTPRGLPVKQRSPPWHGARIICRRNRLSLKLS